MINMKKIKIRIKIKDVIYLSLVAICVAAIIVLSIMLGKANQRKREWEMGEFYNDRLMTFAYENMHFSKGQIVFIGDSITNLYCLDDYFANLDLATYNRGIGGDTTEGVLNRLQTSIFDIAPSKIVLMIGTNDVSWAVPREEIVANYRKILDEIKKNQPTVEICAVSVIPQSDVLEEGAGFDVDGNNETIRWLNAEIQKLCGEFGCVYIDLYPSVLDADGYLDDKFTDDGLHLNAAGYEIWSNMVKPYLQK